MTGLAKRELDDLTRQLQQARNELRGLVLEKIKAIDEENYNKLAGQVHDRGEESVATLLSEINISFINKEVAELGEIEDALARIQNNQYGHCEECTAAIPLGRLQANPLARRCLACQQKAEDLYGAKDATPTL